MVRETWRPVEDGEYEAQHISDSFIIEGECLTVQEHVTGSGDTQVATIALPDDRRICGRVADQLITPEALEAAGWKRWRPEYDHYHLYTVAATIGVYPPDHTVAVYQNEESVVFTNVRTMAQLSALVEMLGGEQ